MNACYRAEPTGALLPEETMLANLVAGDREPNSGLQAVPRMRRRPLPRGCWPLPRLSTSADGGNRPTPRQRPRRYPIVKGIEYDTCMSGWTVVKLRCLPDGGIPLLVSS